jgi:branched-chain amino acid transport system substrate-binding protein
LTAAAICRPPKRTLTAGGSNGFVAPFGRDRCRSDRIVTRRIGSGCDQNRDADPDVGADRVYGIPVLKGIEMAAAEINAKGGVLGRKIEVLARDSKANADEAVRLARELIIKDNVDSLVGTLTSTEAPAVSTVAKENKIVLIVPALEMMMLTDAAHIHPYIFRVATNTDVEGAAGASIMARWKNVKTVATISPDYAYGERAQVAAH